jgi:predicted glycoside hydrolase/deacetylase ChbG (UPF0249 family)
MKKLIINADDFGYRKDINKGVIYAHQNGLVTSASLFVDREGTEDAVNLAKNNPTLGMGIHLDLDRFFEVDHHAGVVVGFTDQSPASVAVKDEARRQLDLFFSFGFSADHLDSHHHAHLTPQIFPLICKLAKEYKITVVRIFQKFYSQQQDFDKGNRIISENGLKTVDHFIEGWYWGNVDEPYNVAELMTHPGYGEIWREAELAHCCQPPLKQYLIDQKIELLRFSDAFA